jgi:hypothetical protein
MGDTRSVALTVDLPRDLADDLDEVRSRNPEFFGKAIRYALARRIVFQELDSTLPAELVEPSPQSP